MKIIKKNTMKILLSGIILISGVLLTGCQNKTNLNTSNTSNDGQKTEIQAEKSNEYSTDNITKKDIKNVRDKIEEIKLELTKIQTDKSLSKEEKTQKIEDLQLELKEITKKAMEK